MEAFESSAAGENSDEDLDRFVAPGVRTRLEERYWRPIERATAAESFLADDVFFAAPTAHPATFSDHGIVHVRDVSRRAARITEQLDGGLLPTRPIERRRLVQGTAVLMAYLHDIGMVAATPEGRRVHPQFAAQTALGTEFDDVAADLWRDDAAGLRSRIEADAIGRGSVPGDVVLREVLALSLGHSKSVVPVGLLDDPTGLRSLMLTGTFTALDQQMSQPRNALWTAPFEAKTALPSFAARYRDVASQAFAWLVDPRPRTRRFVADVIDAIRVLRAADALRQRGTTQRTSAGYEICLDRRSGRAVMALRSQDRRFSALMWIDSTHSIAESNLRVVDLTGDGSLRIAFHRGEFSEDGATERVVAAVADTVADVEADALESFMPAPGAPRSARRVEVVPPPDDPSFADLVVEALERRHPRLVGRVVVVDELHPTPPLEVLHWFGRGVAVTEARPEAERWFDQLGHHGLNLASIDRRSALRGVRRARLRAGEVVLSPGTAASVVVIPLEPGARVEPIGGYRSEPLHPWLPIGVTGVVRGAERNATVIADADVDVLAIPAERYLADWFRPFSADQLGTAWHRWLAAGRN